MGILWNKAADLSARCNKDNDNNNYFFPKLGFEKSFYLI